MAIRSHENDPKKRGKFFNEVGEWMCNEVQEYDDRGYKGLPVPPAILTGLIELHLDGWVTRERAVYIFHVVAERAIKDGRMIKGERTQWQ